MPPTPCAGASAPPARPIGALLASYAAAHVAGVAGQATAALHARLDTARRSEPRPCTGSGRTWRHRSHPVPHRQGTARKPNSPASSPKPPTRSSSSITAAPTTPPPGSPPRTRRSRWSTPPPRSPSPAPSTAASPAPATRTSACSTTTCCSSPASSPRCERAFQQVPDLFSATAQIRFPAGVRREETGKTVFAQSAPEDFPVRCDEPLPGEDGSYVLYGSGGCSLYDTAKLRALGNVDEVYEPAYVEDLDLGYRAWQRGWPSVYVAGAVVEHRHRATTIALLHRRPARAHSGDQLPALRRPRRQRSQRVPPTLGAGAPPLVSAQRPARPPPPASPSRGGPRAPRRPTPRTSSSPSPMAASASFPGAPPAAKPRVLVASPYLPFPLSHGGAVRMYNLMRRAAEEFDLVLVAFTEHAAPPPPEVLAICAEVVLVRRAGSHDLPFTGRPEVVEEFDSPVVPRRTAADRPQVAPRHRPTGIHPTRAVRRRLRARPHHPGGARHHLRSLPAAAPSRRPLGTAPRTRPLAQVRNRRLAHRGPRRHHERTGPPHRDRRRPPSRCANGVDLDRFRPGDLRRPTRAASSSSAASPTAPT